MIPLNTNHDRENYYQQDKTGRSIAVGLGAAACVLYVFTLYPAVGGTLDSPELQIAGKVLGITHPTGYPVYCLLSRLLWILPIGTLAIRTAFLSSICMALAVSLLFLTARRLNASYFLSTMAAVYFMFCTPVWRVGTVTEVYALQTLITAAVIYIYLIFLRNQRRDTAYILAFVLGVGFTHHLSTLFLLAGILITSLRFGRPHVSHCCRLIVFFCLPWLSYLYLPFRYAAGAHSFDLYSFESLWDYGQYVLGGANTNMLNLQPGWILQKGFTGGAGFLLSRFGFFAFALAVNGVFRPWNRQGRAVVFLLWILLVHVTLAGIWTEADREAIALPALFSASLFFALGLESLRCALVKSGQIGCNRTLYLFAGILVCLAAFTGYEEIARRNRLSDHSYFEAIYLRLPPHAVVLSSYWENVNHMKYMAWSGEYESKELQVYRWNDPRAHADLDEAVHFLKGKNSVGTDPAVFHANGRIFMLEIPPDEAIPSDLEFSVIKISGERYLYEIHLRQEGNETGENVVRLSKLPWNPLEWKWSRPVVNKTLAGNPLMIQGKVYRWGWGVHGGTVIQIPVPPGAQRFTATVGPADDLKKDSPVSLQFIIRTGTGFQVESPVMRRMDEPFELNYDVANEESFLLEISGTEDGINSDHAVIADPRFLMESP